MTVVKLVPPGADGVNTEPVQAAVHARSAVVPDPAGGKPSSVTVQLVPASISRVRTEADDSPAGSVTVMTPGMQLTENRKVPPCQWSAEETTFVIRIRPVASVVRTDRPLVTVTSAIPPPGMTVVELRPPGSAGLKETTPVHEAIQANAPTDPEPGEGSSPFSVTVQLVPA